MVIIVMKRKNNESQTSVYKKQIPDIRLSVRDLLRLMLLAL